MSVPSRGEALAQLSDLSANLAATHRELADLLVAEHRAKTESWFASDSQYIKERERVADFNALDLTLDVMKLKGEIAALTQERDFLVLCVQWGSP